MRGDGLENIPSLAAEGWASKTGCQQGSPTRLQKIPEDTWNQITGGLACAGAAQPEATPSLNRGHTIVLPNRAHLQNMEISPGPTQATLAHTARYHGA